MCLYPCLCARVCVATTQTDISATRTKIKIETREQVATVKWWLRQSWKDERLVWNTSAYTFGKKEAKIKTIFCFSELRHMDSRSSTLGVTFRPHAIKCHNDRNIALT
mmetsp:Transcript_8725/g.13859  ORF Transcript_8725/g.13859 Transcript_8725/m.13859 type:complete len:107 (+) Transcript_8725:64-384(+)